MELIFVRRDSTVENRLSGNCHAFIAGVLIVLCVAFCDSVHCVHDSPKEDIQHKISRLLSEVQTADTDFPETAVSCYFNSICSKTFRHCGGMIQVRRLMSLLIYLEPMTIHLLHDAGFCPRDVMLARVLALARCLFVCLSQVGFYQKIWFWAWRLFLDQSYTVF